MRTMRCHWQNGAGLKLTENVGVSFLGVAPERCGHFARRSNGQLRHWRRRSAHRCVVLSGKKRAPRLHFAASGEQPTPAVRKSTPSHQAPTAAVCSVSETQKRVASFPLHTSEETNGGAPLAEVRSDASESDGRWPTLSAAVEGGAIKKLGELQVLDKDMCVSNDTSWDKVLQSGPIWADAVDATLKEYQRVFGDQLVSVYVRGSVPRGLAVPGVSDLDMLAYVFDSLPQHPFKVNGATAATPVTEQDWNWELDRFQSRAMKQYPFLTGIEMRVAAIEPASPEGLILVDALSRPDIAQCLNMSNEYPGAQPHRSEPLAAFPINDAAYYRKPTGILPLNFPLAFLVKAQGLRIWGLDVQALLPPEAARPIPRARPMLRESLKQAISYGRMHVEAGDWESAGAVYKWALKRCIRAGFESVMEETGWTAYTRDLYWCCHVAARHRPALEPVLAQALLLCLSESTAVAASRSEVENCFQVLGNAFGPPILKPSPNLNGVALKAKRFRETQQPASVQYRPSYSALSPKSISPPNLSTGVLQRASLLDKSSYVMWLSIRWRTILSLLGDRDLEAGCVAAPLPAFKGSIAGAVAEFEWGEERAREAALRELQLIVAGSPDARPVILRGAGVSHPAVEKWSLNSLVATSALSGLVRVSPDFNFMYCEESHADVRSGRVAAPSRTVRMSAREFAARSQAWLPPWTRLLVGTHYFWPGERYYMQASLPPAFLQDLRADLPPFNVAREPAASVASASNSSRLHRSDETTSARETSCKTASNEDGSNRPWIALPLARKYAARVGQVEGLLAGDASSRRQHSDDDVSCPGPDSRQNSYSQKSAGDRKSESGPAVSARNRAPANDVSGSAREEAGDDVSGGRGWELSQEPRLWMSPRGAVSPLHFDASPSCLLQVRGRKRMLLYAARDLPALYPYPDDHPLRRRARVDPIAPDLAAFPAFAGIAAFEAVLAPGDVIFFPSQWAHYTESLDFSMSATCRFFEALKSGTSTGAAADAQSLFKEGRQCP